MSTMPQKPCEIQSLRVSVADQLTRAGEEIFGVFEKRGSGLSKNHMVRLFVTERLAAAAEQIVGMFEREVTEYRRELARQSRLLDIILNPEVKLNRADPTNDGFSSDCSVNESEDSDDNWKDSGDEAAGPNSTGAKERRGARSRKKRKVAVLSTPHYCHICGKAFCHKNNLIKHVETHPDNPECLCGVCGERFESTEVLLDHLKSYRETAATSGTCDICCKSFQNMETHMRSHTGVKPYSCSICAKSFPRPGALRRHKKIHTRVKPDICQFCGETFMENDKFQVHLKTHEGEDEDVSEDDDWPEDPPSDLATLKSKREKRQSSSMKSAPPNSHCCKVCGDCFHSKGFLRKHAETHCKESECVCGVCGEPLESAESLVTHLQSHRETSGKCLVCGKSFQNMETHMRSHTGIKPYSCSICAKRFPRPGALRRHKKIHTGERPYVCKYCGKAFIESSALKTHIKSHSWEIQGSESEVGGEESGRPQSDLKRLATEKEDGPGQPVAHCCKVCGESFQSKSNLRKHAETHSAESESVCGVCGEHLQPSETMIDHLQSHRETGKICHVCGKTYQNIDTHMRSHTGIKPYNCIVCGKRFPRPGALRRHKKIHTGERPYICEFCGKTFIDNGALTTHIRNHTGDKPANRVSCETCGKSLASVHVLEVHKRIHTGEKPFQCRVCGKAFRQVGGLNAHMMTHTGEKPFSCGLCSKSFSTKGYLETHVRFHKKDKPYSCHLCWKAFVTKNDLKKHLLTHTGEKPYSCRICGKSYQEKRSRDVHMKIHLGVRQGKEPYS
ncbi:uncharacterized protein ACN63O_018093 [Diretmus argenteus]